MASGRFGRRRRGRDPGFLRAGLRGGARRTRAREEPLDLENLPDHPQRTLASREHRAPGRCGAYVHFSIGSGTKIAMEDAIALAREGRISPGCAGMYKPEHVAAWTRIVDFVHAHSRAKIRMQLGHAGRKGSTRLAWEGIDEPLKEGAGRPWPPATSSTSRPARPCRTRSPSMAANFRPRSATASATRRGCRRWRSGTSHRIWT